MDCLVSWALCPEISSFYSTSLSPHLYIRTYVVMAVYTRLIKRKKYRKTGRIFLPQNMTYRQTRDFSLACISSQVSDFWLMRCSQQVQMLSLTHLSYRHLKKTFHCLSHHRLSCHPSSLSFSLPHLVHVQADSSKKPLSFSKLVVEYLSSVH